MKNIDPELRLAEIEIELEIVRKKISKMERDDPCDGWDEFSAYMESAWDKQAKLDREKRMLMIPEFTKECEKDDDVMPLKDFIEACNNKWFIDYDGFGYYVKDGKESNIMVHPSDIEYGAIRKDFDTIVWFNK